MWSIAIGVLNLLIVVLLLFGLLLVSTKSSGIVPLIYRSILTATICLGSVIGFCHMAGDHQAGSSALRNVKVWIDE